MMNQTLQFRKAIRPDQVKLARQKTNKVAIETIWDWLSITKQTETLKLQLK